MAAQVLPPNPSLVLYNATVEIRSSVHGSNKCGSGALVRVDDRVFIATNFHVIGRFLANGTPAFRENLAVRHIATNQAILFGNATVLTDAFIVESDGPTSDYENNLDAALIEIPQHNNTYLPSALYLQSVTFEQVMGSVVHGYGCKFGTVKFFSGEVCSKLEEHTFCVSSQSTEKGISGSACTIGNVCIGLIQGGTTGRDDPVRVPGGQTVRTLASYATDQLVTALFHHSKLTFIVSSSVLLRISAGIVGGTGAPAVTTLSVNTAAVHDTEESIATSSDDDANDYNLPVRHARRNSGGMTATAAGPMAPVVHNHVHNHYSCCTIM